MMEEVSISGEEAEGFDLFDGKPSGERWAPVGASELDDETQFESGNDENWYVCIVYCHCLFIASVVDFAINFLCTVLFVVLL